MVSSLYLSFKKYLNLTFMQDSLLRSGYVVFFCSFVCFAASPGQNGSTV